MGEDGFTVSLPASRLFATVPVIILFAFMGLIAAATRDALTVFVGLLMILFAVWKVASLWVHEVVRVSGDVMLVEARFGGRVLASKSYEIGDVYDLRGARIGLGSPEGASGVPFLSQIPFGGPGLTFEYRGNGYFFAGTLDAADLNLLLELLLHAGLRAAETGSR